MSESLPLPPGATLEPQGERLPLPSGATAQPATAAQTYEQQIQAQMPAARERQSQRVIPGYGPLGPHTEAVEIPILSPLMQRAGAAIGATMGRGEGDWAARYASELARSEAQKRAFQEANPVSAAAGQIAGAALTIPFMPSLTVPRAAAIAEPALGAIGRYIPQAVSEGAAAAAKYIPGFISRPVQAVGRAAAPAGLAAAESGAFSAAEEAAKFRPGETLGDVASRAAQEGQFGALVGGGLRAGLGAAGAGYNWARNLVRPEEEIAQAIRVARAPSAKQISAEEFERARAAGLPVSIVDIPGVAPLAQSAMGRVRHIDEPLAQEVQQFLGERARQSSTLMQNSMDRIFGRNVDADRIAQEAKSAYQAASTPAYRAAYAQPGTQHVWNPYFEYVLNQPIGQSAAKEAIEGLMLRSQTPGGFVNPFVMQNGRLVVAEGAQVPLEFWDRFRRSLADTATELRNRNQGAAAGDIMNVKNNIQNYLTSNFSDYRKALTGAARYLGEEDAFEAGKKFFDFANVANKVPPGTVGGMLRDFDRFKEGEKQAFRYGLASFIRENPTQAAKVFGGRDAATLDRYRQILGDDAFNQINSTMLAHNVAQNITGLAGQGSRFERLRQGIIPGIGIASVLGSYAYTGEAPSTGHVLGALAASGISGASSLAANARARQILRLVMSENPEDVQRVVDLASRQPSTRKLLDDLNSVTSRAIAMRHEQPTAPRFAGGRVGRASGGRLVRNDHAAKAAALVRAAEAAKKAHNKTTEDILEQPDEAVAKALSIANKAI